jgi:hypothetical protein
LRPGLNKYDSWIWGRGKRYALPGIRASSRFTTALAELAVPGKINVNRGKAASEIATGIWFPTLWKAPGDLKFVPFVIQEPVRRAKTDGPGELQKRLVDGLRKVKRHVPFPDIEQLRFRVAFPVAAGAMKSDLQFAPANPNWRADSGLRQRIGKKKRIVIMAIIDDGLPFAHRNFRDANGERTRVEFCWLQSAKSDTRQKSVLFGREYTRAQIEDYIARYCDDEDALYHAAGATTDAEGFASMLGRHTTHGAHVMDLATGYARERGEVPAEEIRIIAVQLPNVVTMDTSGFGKDMYLLSAFHYIFHRADLIAEKYGIDKPRLVINFSYGYSGGRHDGQVDVEAAIEELVKIRRDEKGPTALVVPAGNTFLDRMHVEIAEQDIAEGLAEFQWRLQPNDRTPSYLEVWFPDDYDPLNYTIEVHNPSRISCGSVTIGVGRQVESLRDESGKPVGQISAEQHRPRCWRVLIVTVPSEPNEPDLPGIEAGAWTIAVTRDKKNAPALKDPIRCWIQRDSDPATLRSGARQSYFDDPKDIRYDLGGLFRKRGRLFSEPSGALREKDIRAALLRRFGSLNGLAAIPSALAVAGFRLGAGLGSTLGDVRAARYSCAGTQRNGWPIARVSCASMSDRSIALAGTVAAGVRSGARSIMDGTSAAAPFVARRLAEIFVRASDKAVKNAEKEVKKKARTKLAGKKKAEKKKSGKKKASPESNYWSLLPGRRLPDYKSLEKDRLGLVIVEPHWQPGLER